MVRSMSDSWKTAPCLLFAGQGRCRPYTDAPHSMFVRNIAQAGRLPPWAFAPSPTTCSGSPPGTPATHADRMLTYLMSHQACGGPVYYTNDVRPRSTDPSSTDITLVHGTRLHGASAGRRSTAPEAGLLPAARLRSLSGLGLSSEAGPRRRRRPARAGVQVTRPCALACAAPPFRTVQPMANRPRTPRRRAVEADRGSAPGPDPVLERLRPL